MTNIAIEHLLLILSITDYHFQTLLLMNHYPLPLILSAIVVTEHSLSLSTYYYWKPINNDHTVPVMVSNCKKLESHDNNIHNIASNRTAFYRIKLATDCFVPLERFLATEILKHRDEKH